MIINGLQKYSGKMKAAAFSFSFKLCLHIHICSAPERPLIQQEQKYPSRTQRLLGSEGEGPQMFLNKSVRK